MNGTWRQRLRGLLKQKELALKPTSKKAGLNETALRDWLDRGQSPSIDNFARMAQVLGVTPSWLLDGDDAPTARIPIVGEVSAGESYIPVDDFAPGASSDVIDFSIDGADPVGVKIRGESMLPVYRPGDILIASRLHGASMIDAINHDCIIRTVNDEAFVKTLKRGSKRGLFTLRSYNPLFDDIEDIRLEWVAPVRWIKRQ